MNHFSIYFLFLLFIYTFCQNCNDKAILSDGESSDICQTLETSDGKTQTNCFYDENTNGCKEVSCEDLDIDECHTFQYKDQTKSCIENQNTRKCELKSCSQMKVDNCQIFPSFENKKCIPNADETACEFKSCEELTSNCDKFFTGFDDQKCVLNSAGTKCEIKKCSDLTSNCENFVPTYETKKCASNGNDGCEIQDRDCSEMDAKKCDHFSNNDESNKNTKCLPNKNNEKCILAKCEELDKTECDKFGINYDSDSVSKCVPDGEKCKLKTCSNLTVKECTNFDFGDENYKCKVSDDKCVLTSCDSMKENCETFIPNNPTLKCVYEKYSQRCNIDYKECEELPTNMCDKFETEEENSKKKCTLSKDKKKCELVSGTSKIKFSLISLCFLAFIF